MAPGERRRPQGMAIDNRIDAEWNVSMHAKIDAEEGSHHVECEVRKIATSKGLNEGIGCMPMEGSKREIVHTVSDDRPIGESAAACRWKKWTWVRSFG